MKKIYTLCIALASFASLGAQTIFSEDFDGIGGPTSGGAGTYTFPSGWFLRNVDNRTPDASVSYVNEAWERREDFGLNVADSCAFSTSYYAPVGSADDWMWTPLIGPLPANTVLQWSARISDPLYADGYEVRIMTSAQGPPTGGTGSIGNQLTNSTQLFSITAENQAWTTRSVSLGTYAGQSVYIGFRNSSNDKFLLLIDDVSVAVQVNEDAELLFADTVSEYTLVPQTQVQALNFNGTIRNNGLNTLNNVIVTVDVFNSAMSNVYTATSTATTLAPGNTAPYSIAGYTPSAVDAYMIRFLVSHSTADQVPGNDTAWAFYTVTDSTYARDDGTVTGALGIGAGNGGYVGQHFHVVNSDDLTSIGMYVTVGYTGRNLGLAVWDMVGNAPNAIIATTDTLIYPDDSARYYIIPMSGGPVTLNPGMYAVTAIEFDSTIQVGQTNSIFTSNTTWVDWPTSPLPGWGNNEDFGPQFAKPYVIRPNFGPNCVGFMADADSVDASCGTCPDGSAMANVSGGVGPYTYLWSPGSMTTQTVSNVLPGTYTVQVTDAQGCMFTTTTTVNFSTGSGYIPGLSNVSVYPNPSNGNFELQVKTVKSLDMDVEVFNALGEKVYGKRYEGQLSGNIALSLQDAAAGIYSVRIRTSEGVLTLPVSVR